MPVTHGQRIATRALKLIGVVGAGETPEADIVVDAFTSLNEMVSGWANDNLTIYTVERVPLTWAGGQASRTIGEGGNFNRARPVWLNKASVIFNGQEIPIGVLTYDEWQRIPVKTTQSTLPQVLFNDRANPLSVLNIYPVPSASITVVLYLPLAISQFATLTTDYDFPPGYPRALRYNLAIEIAPEHEVEPPASVIKIANESLDQIRTYNSLPETIPVDGAITRGPRGGVFDYRTGW